MNANQIIGIVVGIVTAVVATRTLRDFSPFGRSSLVLGLCGGVLAAIGVSQCGFELATVVIPWAALGLILCLLFLVRGFAGLFRESVADKIPKKSSPPKCSASKPSGPQSGTGGFRIGTLLPPGGN